MSKILVVAEKPSVAGQIAHVLGANQKKNGYLEGNGYLVSWCLGHLAEYAPPDYYDEAYQAWKFEQLPIVPAEWKLLIAGAKKDQFKVVKELMKQSDVEYVVDACDAGREGELIFQRVYELSGSHKPTKRLWISSLEDSAIQNGFDHLKDGAEYENLRKAAVCRAKADWLVGMNGSRALTTTYKKRLTVGRVQCPTLAMLVERNREITNFVKEKLYQIKFVGEELTAFSKDYKDVDACAAAMDTVMHTDGIVQSVKKTQKQKMQPKLYDLTTLQREANRYYGYTAQQTLSELQELYEHKLITYPRTDSCFVTEDMKDTVQELLEKEKELLSPTADSGYGSHIDRIINNAKVSDHHAILLTMEGVGADREELSEAQRNLFDMIALRLAVSTADAYVYDETVVTVDFGEESLTAKGKTVVNRGFTALTQRLPKNEAETEQEEELPLSEQIREGMTVTQKNVEMVTRLTNPPKPYSDVICCICRTWIYKRRIRYG